MNRNAKENENISRTFKKHSIFIDLSKGSGIAVCQITLSV